MDIKTAETTLQTLITQKESELESLKVALSVLDSTYKPDLTALEEAQNEADTQRNKAAEKEVAVTALEQEKGALESKVAEHESTIETLTADKADLQVQLESVTAEKEGLQTQIETLTPVEKMPAQELPTEEVTP